VKTVADRYIHVAYHNKHMVTGFLDLSTSMTLNYFKPPKEEVLMNFSQFLTAAHISTANCDEIGLARDRPRALDQDNLRMKFSALNADFNSPGPDSLGSRRPSQMGVKDVKSGYFIAIDSFSMKTVGDGHRYTAYHNKH